MQAGPGNERALSRRRQFGQQVRRRRQALGLSQEGLADIAELDRTYVGSVERGERNISLDNIWRVADALGAHPRDLLQ